MRCTAAAIVAGPTDGNGGSAMAMRWNLADLFELVAETVPERLAVAHGTNGALAELARARRAHQRARPPPPAPPRHGRQARGLLLQPARVRRGAGRRDEGAARAGERELPLPRRRARLPVRQLRRERGDLRGGLRRPRREDPRPAAAGARVDRAATERPATPSPRPTRRRRPATPRASTSSAARTTWSSSTPAAPPACRRA